MLYRLENIYKKYQMGHTELTALNGITLEIDDSRFFSIIGPSGSGKSTLLHLLGILDKPTQGKVFFNGIDINLLTEDEKSNLRNINIGFVFQKYFLIPVLNVYENIEIPFLQNNLVSLEKISQRIHEVLDEVGLTAYKNHKPNELSGGQQQRVAIARALALKPKVILADEPTANLDSKTSSDIIALMRRLNKEEKITFICSTHDPMILEYSDKVFKIKDGLLQ